MRFGAATIEESDRDVSEATASTLENNQTSFKVERRGGYRENGGRKPGGKNKATLEREALIAAAARDVIINGELTPEVVDSMSMLAIVQFAARAAAKSKDWARAVAYASVALPYTNARLASITVSQTDDLTKLSKDELRDRIAQAARLSSAGSDSTIDGECSELPNAAE